MVKGKLRGNSKLQPLVASALTSVTLPVIVNVLPRARGSVVITVYHCQISTGSHLSTSLKGRMSGWMDCVPAAQVGLEPRPMDS